MIYTPMLRGTVNKANAYWSRPKPPTLKNQVQRLERQVARNRPERQYFTDGTNTSSFSLGYSSVDTDITSELVGSAGFRNKITGDKWMNESLKFMFYTSNGQINHVRVVIYSHKRPGASVSWGTGISSLNLLPDPSAVKIYYDRTFNQVASASTQIHGQGFALCKSLTLYNSDSGTIERNAIRIAFIVDSDGSCDVAWSAELALRNK